MGTLVDIQGKRFGRLTVVKRAGKDKWGSITWLCKCDCGKEKTVHNGSLTSGASNSCGCYQKEQIRRSTRKRFTRKAGVYFEYELLEALWTAKKRDNFTCRMCGKTDVTSLEETTKGLAVHHYYPKDDFPEYACCLWNLITLCLSCHMTIHNKPTHYPEWIKNLY
jgi:hypothetical protein